MVNFTEFTRENPHAGQMEQTVRMAMENLMTCGDFGGVNAKGLPCGLKAGFGTTSDTGRCKYHLANKKPGVRQPKMRIVDLPGKADSDEAPGMRLHKPDFLSALADKEWRLVVEELNRRGVLSQLDNSVTLHYVLAYEFAMKAAKILDLEGLTYFDADHGADRKHPAFQIWRDSVNTMISLGDRLGMSPKAREALKGIFEEDDGENDPLAKIIGG